MWQKILLAAPFVIAVAYYLVSPYFSRRAIIGFENHMKRVESEHVHPDDLDVRGHEAELEINEAIHERALEWVVDAPQIVPTILLPVAGLLFAAITAPKIALLVALIAAVVTAAATLWIYSENPIVYRSRRLGGYTCVALLGMALNTLSVVAILIWATPVA